MNNFHNILQELKLFDARLVAVSKTKSVAEIMQLYDAGQRDFGENKVQEMQEKQAKLPQDIRWHLIGHLQTNKVKFIAPFVHLIHSVDSWKLLLEINKQAEKSKRVIDCLLQIHIAKEETKFGFNENELNLLLTDFSKADLKYVRICGLMGMATNTENESQIAQEFEQLHQLFVSLKQSYFSQMECFKELSMGMSNDYKIALKHGATMVRIGSLLFGSRV